MTVISERMVFGGAVMTSALVSGSAQIVTDLSAPPAAAAAAAAPGCAAADATRLLLQLARELFRVGVIAGSGPAYRRRLRAACRGG